MPTVLLLYGWRFYFYSNEGNEPIHIHADKGEKKCKYWLDSKTFSVEEGFTRKMSPRDKRQVIKIIFENFEFIESEWKRHAKRKK